MPITWSQLVQSVLLQVRELLQDGYSVFANILADTLSCEGHVCAIHLPLFKKDDTDLYTFRLYDDGDTCDVVIARTVVDPDTGEKTSSRHTMRYVKTPDGLYVINAIYDS